ncbi:hypothetical protein DFP72DRAFT_840267 [Ephemerocybe angulata]|uniref:Transcription activator of gluconeogenesis ERT1 n=1 Tax=Ephemerocybe angulata TaxID=980116 RepID=A0A8H6IEL0_9AGAR|nr:hypothetical protein DFP72DRAFT_840267 [Tulosesus angulatus]
MSSSPPTSSSPTTLSSPGPSAPNPNAMTEQNKAPAPSPEHPYPPVMPYPPQAYSGAYPPPPPPGTAPYPPYFYPPPGDANHGGENGQNGLPPGAYMMLAPPGVVYMHPPPQGQPFQSPSAAAQAPSASRPKRKQVKMACTNCAAACKRCDENRPCERCQKYGIADNCIDGQRKERKKGIKRGPYKRKNKGGSDSPGYNAATAAIVAAQLGPEAAAPYYQPIFYPPPPYMTHTPEGQPGPDGQPPHVNGQPMMQYYIPAGSYPPYPHYHPMYHPPPPHPGAPPPPHPGAPPVVAAPPPPPPPPVAPEQHQTVNPVDTGKKDDVNGDANGVGDSPVANGKKRSRSSKGGEGKSKRSKPSSGARRERDGVAAEEGHEEGATA